MRRGTIPGIIGVLIYLSMFIWAFCNMPKIHGSAGFEFSARLSATDQEADEGYFALDQQQMIVVKPGSELHAYLRGQAGKRVRVSIEPDAD